MFYDIFDLTFLFTNNIVLNFLVHQSPTSLRKTRPDSLKSPLLLTNQRGKESFLQTFSMQTILFFLSIVACYSIVLTKNRTSRNVKIQDKLNTHTARDFFANFCTLFLHLYNTGVLRTVMATQDGSCHIPHIL